MLLIRKLSGNRRRRIGSELPSATPLSTGQRQPRFVWGTAPSAEGTGILEGKDLPCPLISVFCLLFKSFRKQGSITYRAMNCDVHSNRLIWPFSEEFLLLQSHIVNTFCLYRFGRLLSDLVRLGAKRSRGRQAELSEPSLGLWMEGEFSAAEIA
jgi:hypothetical protein